MDHRQFILENTTLQSPSLLPELRLHLADKSLPLWQKTIDDLDDIGLEPPYWAFAWAGGQALARYLLDGPALVAGKRILDLGAGSGLCGICAVRCGAAQVICADVDPLSQMAILLNAAANDVDIELHRDDLLAETCPRAVDVLLLGDLFYEAAMAQRVLAVARTYRDAGSLVIAGDPQRSYFPRESFTQVATYSVPVSRELEDADVKRATIWKFV